MASKCPPGVLCIENMTVIFLICIIGLVGLYIYYTKSSRQPQQMSAQPIIIREKVVDRGFLYTFATSTNEARWPKVKNMFEDVVKSFRFLI